MSWQSCSVQIDMRSNWVWVEQMEWLRAAEIKCWLISMSWTDCGWTEMGSQCCLLCNILIMFSYTHSHVFAVYMSYISWFLSLIYSIIFIMATYCYHCLETSFSVIQSLLLALFRVLYSHVALLNAMRLLTQKFHKVFSKISCSWEISNSLVVFKFCKQMKHLFN